MIRRALLKAIAIPGHQIPFGSREMPMAYGWGTGGIQVTTAIIGRDDIVKVIDQGSDQTTNAVNIRRFFSRTTGVRTTSKTSEATIVQTRHRVPETPLTEQQVIVYQVPSPEPLYDLEPRLIACRKLHALAEYGLMNVKLYEDIVRYGTIATGANYPVIVNNRYLTAPSPIPKFDNPKLHMNPALQLFGAGRERKIYAIPPYTEVRSLDFEDFPFAVERWDHACELCGSNDSYLDEMILDDKGTRMFVCSDSEYCEEQRDKAPGDKATQEAQAAASREAKNAGDHE
nr:alpha-D-ribose 1-methylphosphonate 5-phosphate C-P-lyase PhnJ [Paraburkholderia aspalathi]